MNLGETLPENLPKALAEALAESLPKTRAEPPPSEGVIASESWVMSAKRGTYNDRRDDTLDKNPYHAVVNARVDVGTTTHGIGQAPEPQFCRGVVGPQTAWGAASADTARGTTNPTTTGTSSRTTPRTTMRTTSGTT